MNTHKHEWKFNYVIRDYDTRKIIGREMICPICEQTKKEMKK